MNTKRMGRLRHTPEEAAIVPFERVQHAVARAYVERVADKKTLDLVHALEAAIADVHVDIAERERTTRERNERKVVGMLLSTSIVALAIAVTSSWYLYSNQGYCGQLGFAEGFRHPVAAPALADQLCHGGGDMPHMASAALVEAIDGELPARPASSRKR